MRIISIRLVPCALFSLNVACSGGSGSDVTTLLAEELAGDSQASADPDRGARSGSLLQIGETNESGYTLCALHETAAISLPGVPVLPEPEGFRFEKLSERLSASATLRASVGFDHVESCEEAFRVRDAARAELERSVPREPAAQDVMAPATDVDLVQKIAGDHTAINSGSAVFLIFGSLQGGFVRDSHICSGTIIDDNAIVTAGHCVDGLAGDSSGRVRAIAYTKPATGAAFWTTLTVESDIFSDTPLRGYNAATFTSAPDYDGVGDQDVGLIVTNGNLLDLVDSRVAYLWDEASSKKADTATFLGYGTQQSNGQSGEAMWRGKFEPSSWTSLLIISPYQASLDRGRLCRGDSGGPIRHDVYDGRHVVAGVASYFNHPENTDPLCTPDGYNQGWAALDARRTWISGELDGGCSRLTTDKGWRVYDCWQ
ncbi:MAG: Trypsin [Pseudomonadota bacterium]